MKEYIYFSSLEQEREVLAEGLWPHSIVIAVVMADSWLEAKAKLSLAYPSVELTPLQIEMLQERGND